MKALYIRYFEAEAAFFVCRDNGHLCEKVTGPWTSRETAQLSLEIQSPPPRKWP